ncbi:MAG: protein kinase, partial [Pseudoxanthomonas sp.]|nr:protein kinase [Pseudoxanthomonas sp.]
MNIDGDRPADMAALAALAFGPRPSIATIGTATRHLAFLPIEALELDLSDPEQRDFGDYELLERLGSGGMGVVYRARQKSLDREVAVKLLSAGPWASADFIERFRREAQSAARLEHPNIVAIHEIGSCDELNYFSMALVRGPNLALQLERDGPLPARRAAQLMRTIAEALHYAHRLGVLHLDLKPGNILIDGKGEPQIADFGLARRIDSTMTVAGDEISGTPGYMAPEQIELERAKLSPVTDVYGLGAIFYELLTGHPPFEAPTAREALALALNDAIHRPRNSRTDIPADLEAICLKCLAREPGERYPSAQALADDLHRFLEGQPVSVRPLSAPQRLLRWTRREPKLAISASAAALALLTGILATSLQWWRAEANAVAAREQTWAARADAAWRLVRDGHPYDATPALLANLRERESHGDAAGADLERLRLGTLVRGNVRWIDAVAIGRPGYAVAFDHAGDRLAVSSGDGDVSLLSVGDGRELWRVGTRNASHMWLTSPVYRVGFTRDGHHLIVDRGEPAPVTHPSGQDNILIDATNGHVMLPPAERFADFRDATYGSDGRFALLRNNQNQVQLFRVDGWMPMTPLQRAEPVNGAWMIGDGGRFIACALPGVVQLMDLRDLTVDHVVHTAVGTALLQAWAAQPDGRLLALGDIDGSVRLLDTQRLSLRELKPSPYAAVKWLSFSADGRWLAAATGDRAFIWDVATGSGGALPAGRYSATRVEVDSDSSTVLVVHPPEAIVWHLPAGTAGADDMGTRVASARTLVAQLPIGASAEGHAASHAPAWRLAASVDVDGQVRLWRWHRDPLLHARVAPQTTVDLHFDGHHVVAVDGREVRVIDVEGERTVSPVFVHPQSVSLAALAPDDRSLVTVSGRQIRVFDWRTGHLRFAPITMVDSPLRLAIARRSSVLLASTGAYRGGRFHELLSTFDLHTGRRLADAVAVPGPLGGLRFSPDGSRVISWRHGELSVRDATTLDRIANDLRLGPDSVEALRATYAAGWHPEAATQAARVGTPILPPCT